MLDVQCSMFIFPEIRLSEALYYRITRSSFILRVPRGIKASPLPRHLESVKA